MPKSSPHLAPMTLSMINVPTDFNLDIHGLEAMSNYGPHLVSVTLPGVQMFSDFNLENHGPDSMPNVSHSWIPCLNCVLPGKWADPQMVS
jgi:hypothetical protein